MRRSLTLRRKGEEGQTIILVAICIVSLLAVAALAIDVVNLYAYRSEIQRAADAAAIAGAQAVADSGITSLQPTDPSLSDAITLATNMANDRINAILLTNLVGGNKPTSSVSLDFTLRGNGNPLVTVVLTQNNLPTFFARIWGQRAASVAANAVAEAYNPGNLASYTPITPKIVKPWLVANADPNQSNAPFVTVGSGLVETNVIGEKLNLTSDCGAGPGCSPVRNPPSAKPPFDQVDYIPVQVTPNAGNNICPACLGTTDFEQSIECADVATTYACGTAVINWDTTITPGGTTGPSSLGAQCLTHATGLGLAQGQDILAPISFPNSPPQITSQSGAYSGSLTATSSSIVTLPILDLTAPLTAGNPVKIDGFMQVFINQVQPGIAVNTTAGDINVTILNIAGCGGSNNGNPAVVGGSGTSPVPVRLITPP